MPIHAATLAMLIAALYVPPFASAMRVLPPSLPHFAAALGIAPLCTLWLEPLKTLARPRAAI